MLDRRPEHEIMREIREAKEARLSRLPTVGYEILRALRAYAHLVQFVVVIGIIVIVMALMWPSFSKAREAAYVTTCLGKLRELGVAMEMYQIDYGAYPRTNRWYIDLAGHLGPLEGSDPFKCQADDSSDLTSYYYLDRSVVAARRRWPSTDIPMLVDESYHPYKTTILWYDSHQTAVDKLDWLEMRSKKYQIARNLDHPEWFIFVPRAQPQLEGEE